ncbi:hypothetical protein [Haloechinothrix sp. LS1_15]|uniref:hypothetical protein n=1 Tax=Haloechinothrix sp. LS1_15 TaxID=2652248 RepID=UPI002945A13E|nr:hypothetical protein [Haloechinothrix sp. LS1_15]MDV6012329.1 hypothetical protein [Haloechinothrix sp. LS1_15]
MLFTRSALEGILAGEIDLAFRRWRRRSVTPGGSRRTAVGVLAFDSVHVVTEAAITEREAARAGYASRTELLAALGEAGGGDIHRIEVRYAGPDGRVALREVSEPGSEAVESTVHKLTTMDAWSRRGPWTRRYLDLIGARPGVRAAELAELAGRDTERFKSDVRRIKELGLTESLDVGYRLSSRGHAVLARLRGQ